MADTAVDLNQLLDSKQGAKFLSMSVYTFNDYVRRGLIKPTRLGGHHRRFRLGELYRFIEDHTDED